MINDQLKDFMTRYSVGKLVLTCASDVIRLKVGSMLQELGYPDTNVISIASQQQQSIAAPSTSVPLKDAEQIVVN